MKTKSIYILFFVGFLTFFYGCSTKKNTWVSRNYQALNTRFNIYFNGNESYKQGLVKISQNHMDDYSEVLLMYPISYHANASSAMGDMDVAVEKSKKAIKNRSIKKKPKKKPGKSRDPKYKEFMSREEYNVMIDDAWLLMGKAEFHKADFLGAVGTFTYVTRHFSTNPDVVSEAKLWMARSYAEMGWYYEAEDMLNKVNKDDFSKKQNAFFAAVNADLLLKQRQYNDAIPFLTLAVSGEKNKKQRTRFQYILGQLYEMKGDNANAYLMYKAVAKSNPPFEMALNAQIKQTETYTGADKDDMLKLLRKMAKSDKYADYLDQIYGAVANIYIEEGDTLKAIENYKLSIDKSTRNGYEKAQSLILLADLYYEQEEYLQAEPYYSEAVTIMNPQSNDFKRVNVLSQNLAELSRNIETVELQDSLQMLSKLPEKELKEKIEQIIAQVIKEEEEAKKREEEERRLAESFYGMNSNVSSTNTNALMRSLGEGRSTSFYFYNQQLMAAGKTDFGRRWGTRRLEDNWRRQVKTSISPEMLAAEVEGEDPEGEEEELTPEEAAKRDNKKPEFYLSQLYTTEEQFELSDEEIKTALYNIGFIYNDKIDNEKKAIETFEELERRFPRNEKLPDVYFYMYQTYDRQGDKENADLYRKKLIAQFPDNKYARILSQPDYKEKLIKMGEEQDKLYEETYYAYLASNYRKVFDNYNYMDKNYPSSYLMPKFALLHSLSLAKTESPQTFRASLEEIVEKYPDSDVVSIAKDMLALMAQGQESQTGESHGNLIALRKEAEQERREDEIVQFKNELDNIHFFVIYIPGDKIDVNKLQYNVAAYNFTKFLIKDFDIELRKFDNEQFLIIRNLENLDEALWYQSGIMGDGYLSSEIKKYGLTNFVVSKDNFSLIFSTFTVEDYVRFYNNHIAKGDGTRIVDKIKQAVASKTAEKQEQQLQAEKEDISEKTETTQSAVKEETKEKAKQFVEEIKEKAAEQQAGKAQETAQEGETVVEETVEEVKQEPKKDLPKFRGLYTFDETAKHYFAFYVISGDVDFEKIKSDIGKYNSENYPLLNMKITEGMSGKSKIILIGGLPDAASAKSYLLRIAKDRDTLFGGLKSAVYRNIIITDDNLETLDRIGNPNVYLDFLREKYLK